MNDFPAKQALIDALDDAMRPADPQRIMQAVDECLAWFTRPGAHAIPAALLRPGPDRYARRELHHSTDHGYSVVAMTWAAGQGTPLHDHDDCWCVEGVWQGRLEVRPYRLHHREGNRFGFIPGPTQMGNAGSTSALLPPEEFHTVRNPQDSAVTVSLHVYQRPLLHFGIYRPLAPDGLWHERHDQQVALDA